MYKNITALIIYISLGVFLDCILKIKEPTVYASIFYVLGIIYGENNK